MGQQGARGLASAGKTAAEGAGEASQGTHVAQAAGGQKQMSGEERVAASVRHQTVTRGGAAGEGSEHEWGSWGNASTIGEGASARSAEGRASASTIA